MEACFREYDRDRDNRLNFAEFCVMMNAKHHSAQVNAVIKTARIDSEYTFINGEANLTALSREVFEYIIEPDTTTGKNHL